MKMMQQCPSLPIQQSRKESEEADSDWQGELCEHSMNEERNN
jgi:hypothetical protein